MGVFLAFAAVDLLGRVLTLLYQMQHSAVRRFSYRTWVLLTAFVNFAFVFYWLFGWAHAQQKQTDCGEEAKNEQEK